MSYPSAPGTPQQAPTCYRHPDRQTYVRCARCNRFICPECMHSASVGHQCPGCVGAAAQTVAPARASLGGRQLRSSVPIVTYGLIGINVLVLVLQKMSPEVTDVLVLWPPAVAGGEVYRLLTSAFLHFGLTHIAFNMLALYFVGPPLEFALGRLRFSALYLLSALGGSVLVYLLTYNAPTAGASGAVFGLFGVLLVADRVHKPALTRQARPHVAVITTVEPAQSMVDQLTEIATAVQSELIGKLYSKEELEMVTKYRDEYRAKHPAK